MGDEIQQAIEEIRRRPPRNKELFMGSIRMLANAIDEKDPYTRGHSERVAFYSMLVAKHMGMSRRGGEGAPLRDHPRRGQDRHRGQDPAPGLVA
jgi:response regulator RpfG family c-di-GMP phosphodiesterase